MFAAAMIEKFIFTYSAYTVIIYYYFAVVLCTPVSYNDIWCALRYTENSPGTFPPYGVVEKRISPGIAKGAKMETILSITLALFAGLMMTRLFKRFNLPDVTSYLVMGVIIGPCVLGRLGIPGLGFQNMEQIDSLSLFSQIALGFIAFSIGSEFRLSQLKKTGKQALIIGIFQALAATIAVDAALIVMHLLFPEVLSLSAAITLGAIASATAPAATLMVVRQYKAKGELTDLLLPIVALDDAVGLVLFAVSYGVAKALDSSVIDMFTVLVNPLVEIVASLSLGALAGFVLTQIEKIFHSNTNRLIMTITFVFLTVALSMLRIEIGNVTLSFSALLVCMMMGTVFCNMCPLSEELMDASDKWTAPLLVFFFVVSGAELDLTVFKIPAVVVIGIVYVFVRSAGKYFGTRFSAKAVHCSKGVVNNLGITLLPQAGVALGMCVTVAADGILEDASLIRNIVLFAILVYELIGPVLTKDALIRVGDIQPQSESIKNRRQNKLDAKKNG